MKLRRNLCHSFFFLRHLRNISTILKHLKYRLCKTFFFVEFVHFTIIDNKTNTHDNEYERILISKSSFYLLHSFAISLTVNSKRIIYYE